MVGDAHSVFGEFSGEIVGLPETVVLAVAHAFQCSVCSAVVCRISVGIGTLDRDLSRRVVLTGHRHGAVLVDAFVETDAFGQGGRASLVFDTLLNFL